MDWIINIVFILLFLSFFLFIMYMYFKLPKGFKRGLLSRLMRDKDFAVAEYESFTCQLAHSLNWFAENNTGALIVLEREDSLDKYVDLGYKVKTKLTSEFLTTVFWNKQSALHDGGVIIRNFNIVSTSCFFPLSEDKTVGDRGRAALGITSITDSIAFVVSADTGKISYAQKGVLNEISGNLLDRKIFELLSFYIK